MSFTEHYRLNLVVVNGNMPERAPFFDFNKSTLKSSYNEFSSVALGQDCRVISEEAVYAVVIHKKIFSVNSIEKEAQSTSLWRTSFNMACFR
ncbi:hypothetical protein AVEN_216819-1 [Araneus ventricosus]|uniref:Uncharacterized protein n=1 Tax=Araneus ventricosus TaxID=182803 RepID=A0A4Y2N2B9_ARAVE|nr:hypothetical protein AVEN_216819-1 [Araneus ventricosus]